MLETKKGPERELRAIKSDLLGSTTDIQGKGPGEKPQDVPGVTDIYDIETEEMLIGSILCDNRLLDEVAGILKPEHWYDPMHGRFYVAMLHFKERGVEILTPFTLEKLVGDDPGLRELRITGRQYFSICVYRARALSNIQKTARAEVKSYAAILIEKAVRRAAIQSPDNASVSGVPEYVDETREAYGQEAYLHEFSDEMLALSFAERNQGHLCHVDSVSKWYVFDGRRWTEDDKRYAFRLARFECREACVRPGVDKNTAKSIASAKTVAAVEKMAKADGRIAVTVDQWDRDPWMLNTPRWTVDLRTEEGWSHHPEDYMTKMTAVAPGGDCPLWMAFLDRITDHDVDLQNYLARLFGYCLTGVTTEHAMFFFYGTGANGKSVLLNTVSNILADYAKTAPVETFTASHNDRHPTELARLVGARLVTATETEEGRRWDEPKIKALTGGDTIAARYMRQDFFEYVPQFKLVIAGNHKPALRSVDEAIRRRLHMVHFAVTIPPDERDQGLEQRLKSEWPGILQWIIDGCLEWQRIGLAPPQCVKDATAAYLEAEDLMLAWMTECCRCGPDYEERSSALYRSYKQFSERSGERICSQKAFSQGVEARGFIRKRANTGTHYLGIGLIPSMTGDD